jgi:hypothetical protein
MQASVLGKGYAQAVRQNRLSQGYRIEFVQRFCDVVAMLGEFHPLG